MKLEEAEFLEAVYEMEREQEVVDGVAKRGLRTVFVRDVARQWVAKGTAWKRVEYWLDKWSLKGWYEWGVTLDLGWLTERGRREVEQMRAFQKALRGEA